MRPTKVHTQNPAGDAGNDEATARRSRQLAWLSMRVTVDAFCSAPLLYLQALIWRLRGLRVRSRNRLAALSGRSPHAYSLWIERNATRVAAHISSTAGSTVIQTVIDCRDGLAGLETTLESIRCNNEADPILIGAISRDGAIQIDQPGDLARLATGPWTWLLPMCPGDRLAPGAMASYGSMADRETKATILYADDDLLREDGKRHTPHFKPDWNPELFEHHDFVTGAAVIRADRETLCDLPDLGWERALVHKALRDGSTPAHLKQVLHHRRSRPQPVVPAKPRDLATRAAPLVTVIIPTRNRHELLRTCVEGLHSTAYPQLETIIVDNDSDERPTLDYLARLEARGAQVLRIPGPFNYSALNNAAVKHASGSLLCFLNNDIEIDDRDWLALLVQHATKPDLGAVGARLLYADGTIQHAGVFTGIGGGAGHAHRYLRSDEPGYFDRARLPQRVSGVTAACMVVAREKFLAVGGFNEHQFPVAFNDVDLCLKLNSRGWQSFYEPRATLIHHESKSRGKDRSRMNRARFAGELAALKQVWSTDKFRDPFHHPELSPFCEQFLIAV
jgi:GT2 family glycosyltransferase